MEAHRRGRELGVWEHRVEPPGTAGLARVGKAGTGLSESCSGCCDSIWFESSLEVCALGAWFLCDSVEVVGGT